MRKVNVVKRGKVFQYKFEIAPQGDKRKFKSKSGFKTRASTFEDGCLAYNNIYKQDVVLNHQKFHIVII